eukprot:m.40427 g.40427  ORF g.40427 m.40427 type:complete len:69 (-) comp8075_c0_seq1:67-273(-)
MEVTFCLVCLRFWMLSILNALLRATSHFHDGLDFSFLGQCGVRSADTDPYAAALFFQGIPRRGNHEPS